MGAKLPLQKQFTPFEAALEEQQHVKETQQPAPPMNQNRQPTPRNKRLLMKHRYLEIARLKINAASRRQIPMSHADNFLPPIYQDQESAEASAVVEKTFNRPRQGRERFGEGVAQKPTQRRARKSKRRSRDGPRGWH